jgi:hypothetical protein
MKHLFLHKKSCSIYGISVLVAICYVIPKIVRTLKQLYFLPWRLVGISNTSKEMLFITIYVSVLFLFVFVCLVLF